MGRSSNKRKSERRSVALVHVFSKGGVTVKSRVAFPPTLAQFVVHAFRHFINDQVEEGMKLVAEVQSQGYDFFEFTMASTTNPQLGDADPLVWAWGAASASALRWLAAQCLGRRRGYPRFFVLLPHQLELTEEGSPLWRLGAEVFTMFARDLVEIDGATDMGQLFAADAPRAYAIFKNVAAERLAAEEREVLRDCTGQEPPLPPSRNASAGRL